MNNLGRSQDAYDRFSAAVEVPLVVLAVVWLPVLVIPLVSRLPAGVAGTFGVIDYLVWAVFVAEYLIKLYLSPSRWTFFHRHLIDLLVIAVPVLRPLRLLRLLRLLTFARAGLTLSSALKRGRELLTQHGLHFVLLSVLAIVGVGAAVELAFEQHSAGANIHNFGDALWWAVVTVTTVGYGDKYPVSAGGRGVAVVLMLTGIGLVGVLSASVASYFVGQRAEGDMAELHRRLDRIEDLLTQALPAGTSADDPQDDARDDGVPSRRPALLAAVARRLTVHAVMQHEKRQAEHPERMLGAQLARLDVDVEPPPPASPARPAGSPAGRGTPAPTPSGSRPPPPRRPPPPAPAPATRTPRTPPDPARSADAIRGPAERRGQRADRAGHADLLRPATAGPEILRHQPNLSRTGTSPPARGLRISDRRSQ